MRPEAEPRPFKELRNNAPKNVQSRGICKTNDVIDPSIPLDDSRLFDN